MTLYTADFVGAALATQSTTMRMLIPVLRAGEVDAYHDARVASRRMRSVLAGYCIKDPELNDELRNYAAVLGAVRDLDVITETIELANLPEGGDVAGVLALIGVRRAAAFADAIEYLDSPRHRALLGAVAEEAADPRLAEGLEELALRAAEDAVNAALAKLDRAEDRSRATNTVDDRHRTRKAAKRVRYLAEGAANITEGTVADHYRAIATQAEAVQDHLGLVTDAAITLEFLTSLAEDPTSTPAQRETLEALAATERRLVEGHASVH